MDLIFLPSFHAEKSEFGKATFPSFPQAKKAFRPFDFAEYHSDGNMTELQQREASELFSVAKLHPFSSLLNFLALDAAVVTQLIDSGDGMIP